MEKSPPSWSLISWSEWNILTAKFPSPLAEGLSCLYPWKHYWKPELCLQYWGIFKYTIDLEQKHPSRWDPVLGLEAAPFPLISLSKLNRGEPKLFLYLDKSWSQVDISWISTYCFLQLFFLLKYYFLKARSVFKAWHLVLLIFLFWFLYDFHFSVLGFQRFLVCLFIFLKIKSHKWNKEGYN